ncbi:hypothetical protein NSMM_260080 [Nitrosomonas mobilis]|uniref:Uncharacterized protein n=1 Tax=Nitrosomonas mobilis TaxID=51642 RepID=A0A1G5SC70_9PROT|nr:hypothetical protein NSMM_260080 [Nitrosomonas mobilis]
MVEYGAVLLAVLGGLDLLPIIITGPSKGGVGRGEMLPAVKA